MCIVLIKSGSMCTSTKVQEKLNLKYGGLTEEEYNMLQ